MKRGVLALCVSLLLQPMAFATWSVIAVDKESGQIVVASATCLMQTDLQRAGAKDLRDIQAVVVPGKGAAVAQARIDSSKRNASLIAAEIERGTEPEKIIEVVKAQDPAFESRQFGILDMQGRAAGFTGTGNAAVALDESGSVGEVHYQIQGNILAGQEVVREAAKALRTPGAVADRVMAAMEAADRNGGDRRCGNGRTAWVAYMWMVGPAGTDAYISVTDEDIPAGESVNPIARLRGRYDIQKAR